MRTRHWLSIVGLLAAVPLTRLQAADAALSWTTYLRSGPDWQSPVLQEAARGATYQALGCAGGWCKILLDGREGFVPDRALNAPPALQPRKAGAETPTDCLGYLNRHARPARAELLCRAVSPG